MAKSFHALALTALLWLPSVSRAAWWAENDYSFGSNKFQRESLTLFSRLSPALVGGANASYYKDGGLYRDKAWAFRAPLMYSTGKLVLSLKPFAYPASSAIRSSASGAKFSALFPLLESDDESYIHLTLSGAAARQRTLLNLRTGPDSEAFSETAFEAQMEKSFYNQFFFLASAAGFNEPGNGAANSTLVKPVLDQADLAYLGTFRPVTALPEWSLSAQIARSMRPDYDSHIYAGYSKISY
ncbi:MAG TPA: hypothetical protein DCZ93_11940, partial [Elusimicrobia bacterium]|nr:hypothetical protein [Elusimicrobiota bacterium]